MRFQRTRRNGNNGNGDSPSHHVACLSCPRHEEEITPDREAQPTQTGAHPQSQTHSFTIPWDVVDDLAHIQCTPSEIAAFFGLHYNSLCQRCQTEHGMKLREYVHQKAEGGKSSLRRAQWKRAIDGGPQQTAMLIWLGKQYLGQSEPTQRTEISGAGGGAIRLAAMSDAELVEEAKQLLDVIDQQEEKDDDRGQREITAGSD